MNMKNAIAAAFRNSPALSRISRIARATAAWNARGRRFELDEVVGPRSARGAIGQPVLFDTGFSNLARTHIFGGLLGVSYPPAWHIFFDDFDRYVVGDWTLTTTEAGAGDATEALADADGGVLLITNDAADNDLDFFQKKGESFKYEAGKPLIFAARFKVSDATQSDVIMGLQITDATPLAVADGIFFQKDDGDAHLDFHVEKDAADTAAAAIADLADDTYVTVQFAYDGEKGIDYGVNGVKLGTSVLTNVPDDEELTISFGIQNGEAVAKTMSVDYIFCAKYMGRS